MPTIPPKAWNQMVSKTILTTWKTLKNNKNWRLLPMLNAIKIIFNNNNNDNNNSNDDTVG